MKYIGIIGNGKIGRAVASLLRSENFKVVVADSVEGPDVIQLDGTNPQQVEKFIRECEISGHKLEIDGVRIEKKDCWGLIRASNTSPNLVMRFEGNTEEALENIKNEFITELCRIFPDLDVILY